MAENAITCPECGLEEPFRKNEDTAPLHELGEFKCDGCRARYVFGKQTPTVVVEPIYEAKGIRWVRLRFQHPVTREDIHVADFDPAYAVLLAKNVLSIAPV